MAEKRVVEIDTQVVRESMELYLSFVEHGGPMAKFYAGAAAALNDLMCRTGNGDCVDDIAKRMEN